MILVWHRGAFQVLSCSGFLVACSVVTAFSAEFKIILVSGRELSLKIDGLAFFFNYSNPLRCGFSSCCQRSLLDRCCLVWRGVTQRLGAELLSYAFKKALCLVGSSSSCPSSTKPGSISSIPPSPHWLERLKGKRWVPACSPADTGPTMSHAVREKAFCLMLTVGACRHAPLHH